MKGYTPPCRDFGPHNPRVHAQILLVVLIGSLFIGSATAGADDGRREPTLDGVYVSLGPVASAVLVEEVWDGSFGGEAQLTRVRENELVSAVGLALGGHRYAERTGGRLWADIVVAHTTRLLTIGLSVGPTVELDDIRLPRWGGQATIWGFAAVLPYIRVAMVQGSGVVIDVGIKVAIPAIKL